MALSGSFYKYATGNFGLYCEWSGSQSAVGNYTDVTLKVYLSYYNLDVSARKDSKVTINGVSETYTAPAISDYSSGWKKKLIKTKTVTVNHDANGKKTGVSLSASWRYGGTMSGVRVDTITASTTIDLNTIDRTAPTVKVSVTDITTSGYKVTATSSVTADQWEKGIGGAWRVFSNTSGTSVSYVVSGLEAGSTQGVKVRARKKSNHVYGTSNTVTVRLLGGSAINSANTITADDTIVKVKMNLTVFDGSFYHKLSIKNGDTTIFTHSAVKFTAGTSDCTVTLNASERSKLLTAMASIKSFTATLLLETYADSACSTLIGTSEKTCVCTTTEAVSKPKFTAFTYADTETGISTVLGSSQVLVQKYSSLKISCTAGTAKNGATIKSYTATIGNSSATSSSTTINVGGVDSYGDLTLTVSCIDSRGYKTSISKTVKVLQYDTPKLTSYKLRRKNEVEKLVQLQFYGSFSSLKPDNSTEKNTLKVVGFYYKKTEDETWSKIVSILSKTTISGNTFNFSSDELIELDAESSYDFHLVVKDSLGSYTAYDLYAVITQGTPLISLRKRTSNIQYPRVGINNPNPVEALDVAGNIAMNGSIVSGYVGAVSGNFDSYTKGGFYRYDGSDGIYNKPIATAGMLEVVSNGSDYIVQRFTAYATGVIYVRAKAGNGTAWTSWSKVSGEITTQNYDFTPKPYYTVNRATVSRQGDVVTIYASVNYIGVLEAGTNSEVGSIPKDLSPVKSVATAGLQGNTNTCSAWVQSTGKIWLRPHSKSAASDAFEFMLVYNRVAEWS